MTDVLKILAVQFNPVVGDINGNAKLAREALEAGARDGADLVVFSEMFVLGYPPEDLVLKPSAVELCMNAVADLAKESADLPAFIIGSPWAEDGELYNSELFCRDGAIEARYDKQELPNYGVFDEQRLFTKGKSPACIVEVKGVKIGLAICEDVWFDRVPNGRTARYPEWLTLAPQHPQRACRGV